MAHESTNLKLDLNPPIVIAGAGGFIGFNLVRYFHDRGRTKIRAVIHSELPAWCERLPGVEYVHLDLRKEGECYAACKGAAEVYNLACDVGGMNFMSSCHVESMRSVLINTHLVEAAWRCGVERYFFASSACVYDTHSVVAGGALPEANCYPANPERGYGWERLYSEIMCQEYWRERGLKTFIARFNNVYGPYCRFSGQKARVIPALCNQVIHALNAGHNTIQVWGTGEQSRAFLHVSDCVRAIDQLTHSDACVATPVNFSSDRQTSINELISVVEEVCGHKLIREYDLREVAGVRSRAISCDLAKNTLGWIPKVELELGVREAFDWVRQVTSLTHDTPATPSPAPRWLGVT
ncbi:MAG: NAD-dependent epimerase/dehydratase family protein [Verrucomicrobiaceae bacterium]|nr:NAD-dependent epimerase/dehydratase family protein [Verrucomicrobiaceae bacterium]